VTPKSLLTGVNQMACEVLRVSNLRHRSALQRLQVPPELNLPEHIYARVSENYRLCGASENKDRSSQNWRWVLQPQISERNTSPEVVLERAVASACQRLNRSDWCNQVPVASGLAGGAGDRRRAIDLIHQRGSRHFEFIELKIASDTPLFAAVEIIGYASAWLLARADPPSARSILMGAERIDLRVLAPGAYYGGYDLGDLARSLDRSVGAIGDRFDTAMLFGFDVLPQQLLSPREVSDVELLVALEARQPLSGAGFF
jgi:hypothetical protein